MSGEARFVSRGLPRTEGWNGAAAFDEGRWGRKSNGSRIACNPTFKSRRRRDIPAAKPLGKPPRFVVARSAPVHKQLVCSHVAGEWHCAGLARQILKRNLWFSKNATLRFAGAAVIVLYCSNTCKTSFRQDLQDYQDYESLETLAYRENLVNLV